MTDIALTPEQAQFVAEAVAQGRYRDVAEVVEAGIRLLQQAEQERTAFIASLADAEAESERLGFLSAADVHREMAEMIDEIARARA